MQERVWAGEMLRVFRSLAGMRQEDAAAVLGISKTAVGHWENGRGLPSIPQLYRLAALYEVDPLFMVDAMNYEGTKVAPAMRDWYRSTHANGSSEVHSQASSANPTSPSDKRSPRTQGHRLRPASLFSGGMLVQSYG